MHEIIKPVEKVKMLTLIAVLSNYDLFHVSVSDGREFNASEIVNENSGSLKFCRTFSSATYSDSYVTSIEAINNQEFICKTLFSTYRITALHNKPDQIIVREHKGWNDIFDLMDVSFFGDRFTDYDTISDEITLVIDPYLLGELSIIEKNKIKHIINIYLNGISSNMQMCRTIYFQVKNNSIFSGVYDIENGKKCNRKLIYDDNVFTHISTRKSRNSKKLIEFSICFKERLITIF